MSIAFFFRYFSQLDQIQAYLIPDFDCWLCYFEYRAPRTSSCRNSRPDGAYLPRFRALALFGRRPPECVARSSLPASENLHNSGLMQCNKARAPAPLLGRLDVQNFMLPSRQPRYRRTLAVRRAPRSPPSFTPRVLAVARALEKAVHKAANSIKASPRVALLP